jgi:hypothetical protein
MAPEPMTLFARIADPAGVARRLREVTPKVHIDGPDDSWSKAVVTVGSLWNKRTLTLTHDPSYYSQPNWSKQMNGMHNYFSGFPQTDRKERALMLPSTFRFSLGILFRPDYNPEGDPRLDVLYAVAESLDGILFTPSALRDARGRILFGAGGEDDEDPGAVWPRVIYEVPVSEPLGAAVHEKSRPRAPEDEPADADPPTPERVARRTLALAAVTSRAILEQDAAKQIPEAAEGYQDLLRWVRDIGIDDEFEPDEWKVLQRPLRKLDQRMQIDSTWRLEGLAVLAWALGRFQIPPHDQLVQVNSLWNSLGWLDVDAAQTLIANATLKLRPEICTLRNRLFTLHWRLTNYRIDPTAMDFAQFVRNCSFGPMDITGLPLVEGDLGLGGVRIDRAAPDVFSCANSAASERHKAVNWLWEGPARYSEASIDT